PVAVATADLSDPQPTAEENAPLWWQLAFEAMHQTAPTTETTIDLPSPAVEVPAAEPPPVVVLPPWRSLVALAWLAGSALLALLTVIRLAQFMLALRVATHASRGIQAEA